MSSESITIWVCRCCMLNHANGDCGCGAYYGEDPDHDPLGLVDPNKIAMGMYAQEHHETCEINITGSAPNDYECDCGTDTYSTSPCQGCGSYLHGERHAVTLWLD